MSLVAKASPSLVIQVSYPNIQKNVLIKKHLPTVADRPTRIAEFQQDRAFPRVLRTVVADGVGSGQCVAWAQYNGFKISGNARYWPTLAKEVGYRVDSVPEVGAIIVTTESSAGTNTGHVTGPIKKIQDGHALITEQNYIAGVVTEGWISLSNPTIKAFIHLQ